MSSVTRRRWLLGLAAFGIATIVAFVLFASRVSALRSGRATGPGWSFPSRVYSDGVTLARGRILPASYLVAELDARGYREVGQRPAEAGTYSRDGDTFEIVLRGFDEAPDPLGPSPPERVRLDIQDGRLVSVERLGEVRRGSATSDDRKRERAIQAARATPRLEPVRIALLQDDDRIWRTWIDLDHVPPTVQDAILASEDRRFYRHIGIDLRGYLRALLTNVRAGQVREGGSTVTQQLARSLFLGRKRTLGRKLAEVPLAFGLETVLGKRRILEMYLNSVYWGQGGGASIGGIDAAARWYFDQPVEKLGTLEGATLAAMIPAPNVFDPFERPDVVRKRRNQVLKEMVASKRLTTARATELALEPLRVHRGAVPADRFPSYSGLVRDQLARTIADDAIAGHGLAVFTQMDLVWQRQAEEGLAEAIADLDYGPRGQPRLEGAFVAIEPGTGAIKALVGGRAPRTGAFNRAYQAKRQTGSAIKPIVYAAAFATGHRLTPATVVPDVPRTFQTDKGPWTPRNDDGTSHTQVTLIKALERSLNVATTNLVDLVGPQEIARAAERFGLGRFKPVMSIGLGSNETTLLALTRAFAVFGDGGRLVRASPIRAIVDRTGHTRAVEVGDVAPSGAGFLVARAGKTERNPQGRAVVTRALPAPVAALMTGMLTNVVRFGVAYPLRKTYGFLRPVAGKTGTTDDYKDAWFVGFTPDIVAGVWVGYDRPRSLGRLAADTALPAWARTVGPMLQGFPPRAFESDRELEWRDIEPWNGLLAARGCGSQPVPFLPGTAPKKYCTPSAPLGPEFDGDSLGVADSLAVE
jgi:penicillin-binding protein 1B